MLCSTCGKLITPPKLDPSDDGLEGYIARNLPEPEKGWCSDECYEGWKNLLPIKSNPSLDKQQD